MEQQLPHPGLDDLRVDEMAEGRWRVCDCRFRATNPRTLLGFIQQAGDRFEVTDARRSSDPVFYGSREAAVAAFLSSTSPVRDPDFLVADDLRY